MMNRDEFTKLIEQNKKLAIAAGGLAAALIILIIVLVKVNSGGAGNTDTVVLNAGSDAAVTETADSSAALTQVPTSTPVPTATPTPAVTSAAESSEGSVMYVSGDGVRWRSEPSTDSDDTILGTLDRDQEVTVIREEGEWTEIEVDGETGYIKSEYLSSTR